jgi:hypothetical protein
MMTAVSYLQMQPPCNCMHYLHYSVDLSFISPLFFFSIWHTFPYFLVSSLFFFLLLPLPLFLTCVISPFCLWFTMCWWFSHDFGGEMHNTVNHWVYFRTWLNTSIIFGFDSFGWQIILLFVKTVSSAHGTVSVFSFQSWHLLLTLMCLAWDRDTASLCNVKTYVFNFETQKVDSIKRRFPNNDISLSPNVWNKLVWSQGTEDVRIWVWCI